MESRKSNSREGNRPLLATSERRPTPKVFKVLFVGLVAALIIHHYGYLSFEPIFEVPNSVITQVTGRVPFINGLFQHRRSRIASKWALIDENFPDPCLIESGELLYAFATRNSSAVNIQVARGRAAKPGVWTLDANHDALPDPGPWTAKTLDDIAVWAPSVVEMVLSL
jgi:hypothetical protein